MMLSEIVQITPLKQYKDERGWLSEIYRTDESNIITKSPMCYISYTAQGQQRGPHEHVYQTDIFLFPGPGEMILHLWNNIERDHNRGEYLFARVGASNPVRVVVPPGIVHGYQALTDSLVINFPSHLYGGYKKMDEVDEIRHEEINSPFEM